MQSDPGADEAAMLYATAAAALQTPRGSGGSGQLSFSSTSSSSTSGSCASSKSAVSECLSAWLNYFQILNGLCSSGYRLAQTIAVLEQWGELPQSASSTSSAASAAAASPPQLQQQPPQPQQQRCPSSCGSAASSNAAGVGQYVTAWDDLARATAVATSTVKSHIVNVLQDFVTPLAPTGEQLGGAGSVANSASDGVDLHRLRELNQQIICETTQTMINIQHQFCVASYESFSTSMCCFVCQAPVGCPHDDGCAMLLQSTAAAAAAAAGCTLQPQNVQQHQQHSPKYGATHSQPRHSLASGGSPSAQASSEYIPSFGDGLGAAPPVRGASPPVHAQPAHLPQAAFFDTAARGGPLPQPGNLLGMKAPFVHRGGSRSPLNCPLFPLSTQRRWSEAAASGASGADAASLDGGRSGGGGSGGSGGDGAGGVGGAGGGADGDGSMRRWSMPWEAAPGRTLGCSAGHQHQHHHQQQQQQHASNVLVAWHQTRAGPVAGGMRIGGLGSGGAMGATAATTASQHSSNRSDRSQSITPDSVWHSGSSQETDGLAEAIQLLTIRPTQRPSMSHQAPLGGQQQQQPPPNIGPAFIEESSQSFFTSPDTAPVYEMWSDTPTLMPCIKFNNDLDDGHHRNN